MVDITHILWLYLGTYNSNQNRETRLVPTGWETCDQPALCDQIIILTSLFLPVDYLQKVKGLLEKTLLTTCLTNQPGQHFLTSCKVPIDTSRTFFDTNSNCLWLHRESHLHNSWFQMHNFTKFNPFRNKVCKNTQHLWYTA